MYTIPQQAIRIIVLIQGHPLSTFQMADHIQLAVPEQKLFLLNKPEIHGYDVSLDGLLVHL
jgi:hypothetical protein